MSTTATAATHTVPQHQPTSRAREAPTGDEEASTTLKLGEFEGVPTLSLSEARLVIDSVKKARQSTANKIQDSE